MTSAPEHQLFSRLIQRFAPGATLLSATPLSGGVSARVTALTIALQDGATQKLIVRRHGAADLARNPHIAADEFKLLHFLHAAGFPAPAPLYVCDDIFPTPCLVVSYIEGGPAPSTSSGDLAGVAAAPDVLQQLAAQLAALHRLAVAPRDLAFLPEQAQHVANKLNAPPASPGDSPDERRTRAALQALWPLPSRNPPVLLHGDFWPGNTLWRDGRLVAVIDWEDAARGDPLADLAISRLELLWAFGADAMQSFTQHYQTLNPLDLAALPAWDLYAALRQLSTLSGWGLDPAAEQTMRAGLHLFIDHAFAKLPAGMRLPAASIPSGRDGTAAGRDTSSIPHAGRPS